MSKEQLLIEGRTLFKHFSYNSITDRWRLSKGSGWHKIDVIYSTVCNKKIELVFNNYLRLGASDVVHSIMTKSVYFTYNEEKYRISDHLKHSFEGTSIIIKWNTDINLLNN